jgi:hypothetical protein
LIFFARLSTSFFCFLRSYRIYLHSLISLCFWQYSSV